MMFLVLPEVSSGVSQIGDTSELSTGISLASLQPTMQALQPMHRVASYSMPTALGGTSRLGLASAGAGSAATALPVTAALRKSLRLMLIRSFLCGGCFSLLALVFLFLFL